MKRFPKNRRKLPKGKRISLSGIMLRTIINKFFGKRTQLKESDNQKAIYRPKASITFATID